MQDGLQINRENLGEAYCRASVSTTATALGQGRAVLERIVDGQVPDEAKTAALEAQKLVAVEHGDEDVRDMRGFPIVRRRLDAKTAFLALVPGWRENVLLNDLRSGRAIFNLRRFHRSNT